MANVLRTKIALLYKSYTTWQTDDWANYIPLRGEVCFCEIPSESHVFPNEPCIMFKVGQGVSSEEGVITGPAFRELPWASAKAVDVYSWAKKEHLDFEDLNEIFKDKLLEYIESKIEVTDTQYRLYNSEDYVWKLQKSIDKGSTWVDAVGEVNIKAVITRMADLESNITTLTNKVADYGGAMSEAEVRELCPIES